VSSDQLPPLPNLGAPTGPPGPPPTGNGLPTYQIATATIGPPDTPTDFPRQHFDKYFRDVYVSMNQYNLPDWVHALITGMIVAPIWGFLMAKDVALAVLQVIVPPFATAALSVIDGLRKTMDTQFAEMAVVVLNELMGSDYAPSDIPVGSSMSDHLARADRVGGIFHNLLLQEFQGMSTLQPTDGVNAAKRFSGLVINFGTATGIIAVLGGLFPWVHLDEIRQIGEEVARNLGLGRLHRLAIEPLIKILMQVPYTWYLNLQFRPTQFSLGDVVNPFTSVTMPASTVHDSLAKLGYSDDKIAALITLHQKRLTYPDLYSLVKAHLITADDYQKRAEEMGIPQPDIPIWEFVEEEKLIKTYTDAVLSAASTAFHDGHITLDELTQVATQYIPDAAPRQLFLAAEQYKAKVPSKKLTLAEIQKLLETGVIDISDFDTYLDTLGYSVQDSAWLRLQTLETLQADQAKAAAKAASAAAKAAKTKAATAPPPATPAPGA